MHMADALLSPAVGATMWAASGATIAHCAWRLKAEGDDSKVPTMGVLGAFIFAAQMINFTIPATGSSGHLGGGMILSVLLGPHAAFLVMASVLVVQALFFGDGGLLALGCNIFNLGFLTSFVAYPLVYRRIAGSRPTRGRILAGSLASAVVALQLGALCVVLETVASGVSALPLRTFLLLMQPIHLAIGVVEGLVTGMVVTFVWRASPEILGAAQTAGDGEPRRRFRVVLAGLAAAAVLTGGVLSWFASANPDGLEWSIARASGSAVAGGPTTPVHALLERVQHATAFLRDYSLPGRPEPKEPPEAPAWPSPNAGTSLSGLVGGAISLALALAAGALLRRRSRPS